jgi:hypothetical protein
MSLLIDTDFNWNPTIWNPSMITTALWLDAADASTVTTVSGAVSQWNDKSGNARHATQVTTASRPTVVANSLNQNSVIRLDATDDFMSLSNTFGLTSATTLYFFGVRRSSVAAAADTTTNRTFLLGLTGAYVIGASNSSSLTNETTVFLAVDNSPRIGTNAASYLPGANVAEIYHVYGTSVNNTFGARVNGTAIGSFLTDATPGHTDPAGCSPALTGFNIGGSGGASNGAVVDFCEMLVLVSAPSGTTIQIIEGYLAHKWGLTANLPAGHPYKTTGPRP